MIRFFIFICSRDNSAGDVRLSNNNQRSTSVYFQIRLHYRSVVNRQVLKFRKSLNVAVANSLRNLIVLCIF